MRAASVGPADGHDGGTASAPVPVADAPFVTGMAVALVVSLLVAA